jgi:hypothetical protein
VPDPVADRLDNRLDIGTLFCVEVCIDHAVHFRPRH